LTADPFWPWIKKTSGASPGNGVTIQSTSEPRFENATAKTKSGKAKRYGRRRASVNGNGRVGANPGHTSPEKPSIESNRLSRPPKNSDRPQSHFLLAIIRVSAAAGAEAAEVFENFGVENRGTDFVDTCCPFAEIDFAAAVAAEGKVFAAGADDHPASGTVEELDGFFSRGHESCRFSSIVQR